MHPRWSNLASFFTPDGFFLDTRLILMRTIIEFMVIGFEKVSLVHTFYLFTFFSHQFGINFQLRYVLIADRRGSKFTCYFIQTGTLTFRSIHQNSRHTKYTQETYAGNPRMRTVRSRNQISNIKNDIWAILYGIPRTNIRVIDFSKFRIINKWGKKNRDCNLNCKLSAHSFQIANKI